MGSGRPLPMWVIFHGCQGAAGFTPIALRGNRDVLCLSNEKIGEKLCSRFDENGAMAAVGWVGLVLCEAFGSGKVYA